MKTKVCSGCDKRKSIEKFYKHRGMADGRLGKCIECIKQDVRKRDALNRKDNPAYVEKERKRGREKYYRLNYRESRKPKPDVRKRAMKKYWERFPEKKVVTNLSQSLAKKGFQSHHWSYNLEHAKDVIYLTCKDHYKLHRFIRYSQPEKMFRTLTGTLLDTKEKHLVYFKNISKLD